MKTLIFFLSLFPLIAQAGPFAPAADQAGTTALSRTDPTITRWATGVASYLRGEDLDEMWQDSSLALGPASGDAFDVVSLGRGGSITLTFSEPIHDRRGFDFAIFENNFSHNFLELAFVEVSSDGVNFTRFPNRSLTSDPIGSFGISDPTEIDGLAGKYLGGFGTPFDLAILKGSPNLNLQGITHIRLIDIAGDGTQLDTEDNPIYDPFPTFGSAGFDLDGIAVLDAPPLTLVDLQSSPTQLTATWALDPELSYQLTFSQNLSTPATAIETIPAGQHYLTRQLALDQSQGFWSVTPSQLPILQTNASGSR